MLDYQAPFEELRITYLDPERFSVFFSVLTKPFLAGFDNILLYMETIVTSMYLVQKPMSAFPLSCQ
ncbi:hypothetical protein FA13DRAFT_1729430 [Coprinellus micaceus]|uniref:Uncharacterized protein n=1 Tax=Coprinellus micaceus TaxID=71717 RepID=A0A4Y7TKQ8_COPMI|nr:hypothetical protein FA13DRAFT_1729430 [Coprinellus micaceus]